jgi:lon-related putative ATP-dependent protease
MIDMNVESASVETGVKALAADALYKPVDQASLSFATTEELTTVEGMVNQDRALRAIELGLDIAVDGFNIFVIGQSTARIPEAVKSLLLADASKRPIPPDWVYVHNFAAPHKPVALELPPGRAPHFRRAMQHLIEDVRTALPAVFESEDYQARRRAIDEASSTKQSQGFAALRDMALARKIAILRTPLGFGLVPIENGEVVEPKVFNSWPSERRELTEKAIRDLEPELERLVRSIPRLDKEHREAVRKLDRETAQFAVGQLIDETKASFEDLPKIGEHLERMRRDLIENVGLFIPQEGSEQEPGRASPGGAFERYEVNVLVSQAEGATGAPVVEEVHPTLANLVGRIEYLAAQGVLVTNFRLIKAGALHRANGGYFLVDIRNLLIEPFSWAAVKRTLHNKRITIEDVSRVLGLASTVSIEPDPIPLDLKVVLFGDRLLYYLLATFDPEVQQYFKILADFDDDIDRSPATEMALARLIASLSRQERLKALDRGGVARLVEHAARLADDSSKLTLMNEQLRDILVESDHCAGASGSSVISGVHVSRAIDHQIERAGRLRALSQRQILEDIALISTSGTRIGQINGLSVISLAGYAFGRPTRITCRVRPGSGKIVDIEREIELGGPIHSKGVLILTGFLAGRYALAAPMSLYASLVFEQSYSGVEGDSASSAELYALLSALSEASLRQDLAVTGSVNQFGDVQAIGGVNEKIEGFFDICHKRGLTGTQGVIIPAGNARHLMLKAEIIDACRQNRFFVYPVATIDQGIALLTGHNAGQRGPDGNFPAGSLNRAVEDRLRQFAEVRRAYETESERKIF